MIWTLCMKNSMGALERIRNHEKEWEVAGLIKSYLDKAEKLLNMSPDRNKLDDIYRQNNRLLHIISEHPRLKLRLMKCQLHVVHMIEAHTGHDMNMADDLQTDIFMQEQNIALADAGRLDEIPQTDYHKYDPIEWTARWEEVIDKADKIAYRKMKNYRGMGACVIFWSERAAALRKFGIEWKTPRHMNPRVYFD